MSGGDSKIVVIAISKEELKLAIRTITHSNCWTLLKCLNLCDNEKQNYEWKEQIFMNHLNYKSKS
jgi:hypothetical protein